MKEADTMKTMLDTLIDLEAWLKDEIIATERRAKESVERWGVEKSESELHALSVARDLLAETQQKINILKEAI